MAVRFFSMIMGPPAWLRWVAVAAWMGLIFAMSAQPDSGEQSGYLTRLVFEVARVEPTPELLETSHHALRKAAHFAEYHVLALLVGWALPWRGAARAGGAWAIATAYAASDELHQAFVPSRGPAVGDVLIDSVGAMVAAVLILGLERRR